MTDYQPSSRDYNQCYESLLEIVATYEGGVAGHDIKAIAEAGIVPHPSGTGWMLAGSDDPIDNGDALWRIIWGNAYPSEAASCPE